MTILHAFWLPILLSSVFVFVASSALHMLSPWHKGDFRKLPEEDKVMAAVRPFAIPPGDYMVPIYPGSKEGKSPDFANKLKQGPVMIMTVMPNGPINMGKCLGLWFVYLVAVSMLSALAAGHALPKAAAYPVVFHLVGLTSFLGYAGALWPMSIWFQRSWATTLKSTIDGLIYAGLTAGTFGWLWPR